MIYLSYWELLATTSLVLTLAVLSIMLQLGLAKSLLIATIRMVLQLLAIGLVLKFIFELVHWGWVLLLVLLMVLIAAREIMARQSQPLQKRFLYLSSFSSLVVSSLLLTLVSLLLIIQPDPWFAPQYAIPLLGMMLGNTMTAIALAIERFSSSVSEQREVIEQRLMLGQNFNQAIKQIRQASMRSAMMPIINSMAASGLVSLPGMMTGQILAGTPPVEAVKYQIFIFLLIAAGTGFGVILAVTLFSRRVTDKRHRLRLDRILG